MNYIFIISSINTHTPIYKKIIYNISYKMLIKKHKTPPTTHPTGGVWQSNPTIKKTIHNHPKKHTNHTPTNPSGFILSQGTYKIFLWIFWINHGVLWCWCLFKVFFMVFNFLLWRVRHKMLYTIQVYNIFFYCCSSIYMLLIHLSRSSLTYLNRVTYI